MYRAIMLSNLQSELLASRLKKKKFLGKNTKVRYTRKRADPFLKSGFQIRIQPAQRLMYIYFRVHLMNLQPFDLHITLYQT